jgi:prepilin-type N-terminal cleavage/methylation domain-containing protein
MKSRKGFTLIELMVVVLIVGILAAVAIPILRGRIDAAKWSEGKAMLGSIATAIRAYHAEKGPSGTAPDAIVGTGATALGFVSTDLDGTYFTNGCFALTGAVGMNPLTFTITCTALTSLRAEKPTYPATVTLNELGAWGP